MARSAVKEDVEESVDELTVWRIAQFEELGFTKRQSQRLERARYSVTLKGNGKKPDRRYERLLDWHRVKKMLDQGASPELVMRIYG